MAVSYSIIIVNYHATSLVIDAIRSVGQFSKDVDYEIIVVDNDSPNAGAERIREYFPAVRWVQMGYNAGFARANNEGIRQSKGEVVLLLNPDVLVEGNAVQRAYQRLVASTHIACGVQLLHTDRTPQISGNYFITGGINHLLPLPVLGKFLKWVGQSLSVKKTNLPEATTEVEVDWINGAFLMVKKQAIREAGLLDEDFFLYAEEIEWCARLRRQGSLCIYGDLHVVHLQGGTANEAFASSGQGYHNLFDSKGRQIMLSNFVRIRKQYGAGWFLLHLLFYLAELPLFLIAVLLSKAGARKNSYRLSQFRGYAANLAYLLGKSGTIVRNRPYFYKA